MPDRRLVAVVDDDQSVRESVPALLRAYGYHARAFASAERFLASDVLPHASCVILDVALPGMSGPDLFRQLNKEAGTVPVIFITAQGNGSLCEKLVGEGAVACLYKPFDALELLEALRVATTDD